MSRDNEDGVSEKMLSDNKEQVKFIRGENKNGDAKINIEQGDKGFTGLTKEELMKFANDPFWVRLRWLFFILFWALWVAMLIGAVMLIIYAPKCAQDNVHKNLYSRMVNMMSPNTNGDDLKTVTDIDAEAVIYSLPGEDTYRLDDPKVLEKIRDIVNTYNNTNIQVILDITPNYLPETDELFISAKNNSDFRSAFVWVESPAEPTNWLAKSGGSAWVKVNSGNYVLSQFGKGLYDLQMNSPIVKDKFKNILRILIELGINGFRLVNSKHYIISKELKDESQADQPGAVHTEYDYWTHTYTTNQNGLGDLLGEYSYFVHNLTDQKGLLSIADPMESPEVYKTRGGSFNFDLPVYGKIGKTMTLDLPNKAEKLFQELNNTIFTVGNKTLLQWQHNFSSAGQGKNGLGVSEYYTFLMLLPGVPVGPPFSFEREANFTKQLDELRKSPSFTHGKFAVYLNANKTVVAYTRIKSGNPGYFVALNPTANVVVTDFTSIPELPEKLTADVISHNYNVSGVELKGKVNTNEIELSPYSACIFTYVPKGN